MKKGISFLFKFHRITGLIIALFFLMWFVTGLVLIYHPYPRLSDEQLNEKKEELPSSLPDIRSIEQRAEGKIKKLSIRRFQGQTLISVATADTAFVYPADSLSTIKPITFDYLKQEAQRWVDAPILRIDTLHERVQWILYSRYDRAMPIYKFYFDNPDKHELFISGKTGVVQQLTDKQQRFWAWIGAIPHKFYLPFIRKNLDLWDTSITVGGVFCFLAALSGFVLGIYICLKSYNQKKQLCNPYKKFIHKWHYALGLIFGIFLITWGISGIFAMQRVPQWLVSSNDKYFFSSSQLWGKKPLPLHTYRLDYRNLKETYPDLKEITWTHFGNIPVYQIIEGANERFIDASSTDEVKEVFIPEQTVRESIRKVHGDKTSFQISLLQEYDDYYLSYKHSYSLPVYKVVVNDEIHSRYYINPDNGYVRYLNNNKMARRWLFNAFHYLNIKYLVDRPALWTACIWILCLGGAAVSGTGVILLIKRIKR